MKEYLGPPNPEFIGYHRLNIAHTFTNPIE